MEEDQNQSLLQEDRENNGKQINYTRSDFTTRVTNT